MNADRSSTSGSDRPSWLIASSVGWYSRGLSGAPAAGDPGDAVTVFLRDPVSGLVSGPVSTCDVPAPSYLALSHSATHVYVTSDLEEGRVSALELSSDGSLTVVSTASSAGVSPCHLAVQASDASLVVSNYASGSAAVLPLNGDGSLGEATAVIQNVGRGSDHPRQQSPHMHQAVWTPEGDRFLLVDLGTDELRIVAPPADGQHDTPSVLAAKNSDQAGSRHATYGMNGYLYVANELGSSVSVFSVSPEGDLAYQSGVSTHIDTADDRDGQPAGIALSQDGRWLYVANRNRETVAVFEVDGGQLTSVAECSTGGQPREFVVIDDYMYVANTGSDLLTVVRVDQTTGLLGPVIQSLSMPVAAVIAAG